jgi:hypothetical protein
MKDKERQGIAIDWRRPSNVGSRREWVLMKTLVQCE